MIYLSVGHHPAAKGASCDGVYEYDEADGWVAELHRLLGDRSVRVPAGSLASKTTFINAGKAQLALELHFNSLDASRTLAAERGCMTLYMPGSAAGKALATAVNTAYAPLFAPDHGVREGHYRLNPAFGADWFLEKTQCPAIICEPEFIDRYAEFRLKRDEACARMAQALIQYLTEKQ